MDLRSDRISVGVCHGVWGSGQFDHPELWPQSGQSDQGSRRHHRVRGAAKQQHPALNQGQEWYCALVLNRGGKLVKAPHTGPDISAQAKRPEGQRMSRINRCNCLRMLGFSGIPVGPQRPALLAA